MKILWITNTIFPDLSQELNLPVQVYGGWMFGLAKQLTTNYSEIQLAVATTYKGGELRTLKIKGVQHFLLSSKATLTYEENLEYQWKEVCKCFQPDIIHIHGTEFAHGLACINACPTENYVVSIQGIVSVISKYYFAGISKWDIFKNITIRDIVRRDTIFHGRRNFQKRGELEKEYFRKVTHVIGRTTWDFAHIKALNSSLFYHFCNEFLREGFYSAEKWNVNKKSDFVIFLSQASYPIKGLHQVLKAVGSLKGEFPGVKVRVAGPNVTDNSSLLKRVKIGGYGSFIKELIEKMNLKENIEFLGELDEGQMIREYKNAHLFICPSSIENSPNSLGEAQLIGVPVISAFVGGVPDMVNNNESGLLYRFEEIEMLAENIRKLFVNDSLAIKLSMNGIKAAEIRHNRIKNLQRTMEVYSVVLNSKKEKVRENEIIT